MIDENLLKTIQDMVDNGCSDEKIIDVILHKSVERDALLDLIVLVRHLIKSPPEYACPKCENQQLPNLLELELRVTDISVIDVAAKTVCEGDCLEYEKPPEEAINWPVFQFRCRKCSWQWDLPEGYTVSP